MVTELRRVPDDVHYFVVRRPDSWIFAPIPAADPVEIDAATVLERMASGLGEREVRVGVPAGRVLPNVAPDAEVEPVWMFVGVVAQGAFVVGAPNGDDVLLDETHVRLLDAVAPRSTPTALAATDEFGTLDDVRRRCAELVSAGCLTLVVHEPAAATPPSVEAPEAAVADAVAEPSDAEAPVDAPTPVAASIEAGRRLGREVGARASDAYRLSSKLRPVRDAVERFRGRPPG